MRQYCVVALVSYMRGVWSGGLILSGEGIWWSEWWNVFATKWLTSFLGFNLW